MKRSIPRPKIRTRDRLFWVLLSRVYKKWKDTLIIVKPDTVVRWHRKGFKLFWRWKALVVCNEREERIYGRIHIMPHRNFLRDLWEGKIIH